MTILLILYLLWRKKESKSFAFIHIFDTPQVYNTRIEFPIFKYKQEERKWTPMKHPALTRVFAAVLAILGVLSLANGVVGFRKNRTEHVERQAYEEKFTGRIGNYEKLHAEFENAADYEQMRDALNKVLEEHEKAAAQHKTDTAIYSATKGGLRMGEQMIENARAQMNELREQLKDAKSRKEFLDALLTELIASNKDKMPFLDALANQAAGYAVDCFTESTKLLLITNELRALMDAEPSPYDYNGPALEPPSPPAAPDWPALDMSAVSLEQMQTAWQDAMVQYQNAAAAYQQAGDLYARQMQEYYNNVAQYETERLNHGWENPEELIVDEAYRLQYMADHAAWEKECKNVKRQADFRETAAELRRLSAALLTVARQANGMAGAVTGLNTNLFSGFEALGELVESTAARLERISGEEAAEMSNIEFLQTAEEAEESLSLMSDGFCVIADNLYNPARLIAEVLEKLEITRTLLRYLDGMLKKAEDQMEQSLAELWYQLGEQDKEQLRLEAEKLGLDEEAKTLARQTVEADELKELRNRHISARLLLTNVPEVKNGLENGLPLPDSARAYLDTYRENTARLYSGKLLINALMILGGVMALAEIPAAFELVRKRSLLIAPVLICLVCAAGAEGLHMFLGEGQLYSALALAIFALVQLLVILPKSGKPRHAPMHLKT